MVAVRQHRSAPGTRHAGRADPGGRGLTAYGRMVTVRVAALFACVPAWLWLWSIHTPWAADLAPRLWLYDVLYYARVLLVA